MSPRSPTRGTCAAARARTRAGVRRGWRSPRPAGRCSATTSQCCARSSTASTDPPTDWSAPVSFAKKAAARLRRSCLATTSLQGGPDEQPPWELQLSVGPPGDDEEVLEPEDRAPGGLVAVHPLGPVQQVPVERLDAPRVAGHVRVRRDDRAEVG